MFGSFTKILFEYYLFHPSIIIVVAIWPHQPGDNWLKILGTLILVSSSYLILYLFLSHFRSEVLHVTRKTLFIILMILSFVLLTRIITAYTDQNLVFPYSVCYYTCCCKNFFYDARLALFILLITIMLADLRNRGGGARRRGRGAPGARAAGAPGGARRGAGAGRPRGGGGAAAGRGRGRARGRGRRPRHGSGKFFYLYIHEFYFRHGCNFYIDKYLQKG